MTREHRIALAVIGLAGPATGARGPRGRRGSGRVWRSRQALARKPKWRMRRKPSGQDMQQEPADELASIERHHFAPCRGRDNPSSGSGRDHSRRRADGCWRWRPGACSGRDSREPAGARRTVAWHRRPIRRCAAAARCARERGRLAKPREIAEEAQLAGVEGRLEALKEQAAIETREDADGQEEARAAGDPASVRPRARRPARCSGHAGDG